MRKVSNKNMKTKLIEPKDFKENRHPSNILFRSIELKNIYELTKSLKFKGPSLDLGCGDGYTVQILFDKRFDYGLDNAEVNNVYTAIKKKRYRKILIESAEKMSLPDESVNFVFSNSVLEHIKNIDAVLAETARVLKKGGNFVFSVPSCYFPEYLYLKKVLESLKLGFLGNQYTILRNKKLHHYHLLSHNRWMKKLMKNKLKIINFKYCVSKDTLQLWDKIAILVFMKKIISKNAEEQIYKKYKNLIMQCYHDDKSNNNRGACLLIHAEKI